MSLRISHRTLVVGFPRKFTIEMRSEEPWAAKGCLSSRWFLVRQRLNHSHRESFGKRLRAFYAHLSSPAKSRAQLTDGKTCPSIGSSLGALPRRNGERDAARAGDSCARRMRSRTGSERSFAGTRTHNFRSRYTKLKVIALIIVPVFCSLSSFLIAKGTNLATSPSSPLSRTLDAIPFDALFRLALPSS